MHASWRRARALRPVFVLLCLAVALAGCGGSSSSTTTAPFTITGFSPASGDPGTEVTITGTGFPNSVSDLEVLFGSEIQTRMPVVSVSPTKIVAVIPSTMPDDTDTLEVETAAGAVTTAQKFSVYDDLYNVTAASSASNYMPSHFIAVGQNGTVLTSKDGVTWTESGFLNGTNVNAVSASGSAAILVGDGGKIMSAVSPSGLLKRSSPTKQRLFGIAQSGSTFVVVGDNGTIIESPDAVTWSKVTSPTTETLISVAWSSSLNLFVACGQNGVILDSSDGLTWNLEPLSSAGSATLTAVAFGNGVYVIAGASGPMLMSTDGTTWSPVSSGGSQITEGMTWTGGKFVAVGDESTVLTSPDGVNWTAQTLDLPGKPYLGAAAFKGSTYLAVGRTGTVVTSTDGVHWTLQRGD